ncbi:Mannosyltransferase 1, CMT1 [Phaffia rhodozyma]|uniref:Mannosyltransferase 1, CMT1 n=1 Tax=Phaffia rhodozyma TaxID=264483 RepID=A0A0F7SIQ3_PHARH|nr:Mannosyltransferase 1, CMT1 [Phaffia rhodozyma]
MAVCADGCPTLSRSTSQAHYLRNVGGPLRVSNLQRSLRPAGGAFTSSQGTRFPDSITSRVDYPQLFTSDHALNTDPTPQSETLSIHLRRLDSLLSDVYQTEDTLRDRKYEQPVFPPTLSAAQMDRYKPLRNASSKYLFTSILFNVGHILPDMIQSLLVAVDFLGPENFGISIVEGPSSDATDIMLERVLAPLLIEMGVDPLDIHLNTRRPSAKFGESNRIEKLAALREEPLLPLRQARKGTDEYEAVVFFNDVYFSGAMLLELILQHKNQESDVTCAWDLLWNDGYFYDVWVARDIYTGDLFQPMGSTWSTSFDLFPTSPKTLKRYQARLPFQAYSCWNGIAVLSSSALLPPRPIHFRRSSIKDGECAQAEVSLMMKDIWALRAQEGQGAKVLVVPGVRLAYERPVAEIVRGLDEATVGGVIVGQEKKVGLAGGGLKEKVDWTKRPPKAVRCHPWPEVNGTGSDINVWKETRWIDPLTG